MTPLQKLQKQAEKARTGNDINELSTAVLMSLWRHEITNQEAEELRTICEQKLQMKK